MAAVGRSLNLKTDLLTHGHCVHKSGCKSAHVSNNGSEKHHLTADSAVHATGDVSVVT